MSGQVGLEGLPLFGPEPPRPSWVATDQTPAPRARLQDPPTSHEAARAYFSDAQKQNRYIHAALLTLGPRGGDCYAIAAQLGGAANGWDHVIVSRRLAPLREAGAVLRLERTDDGEGAHKGAHVHIAAEYRSSYREQDFKPEPPRRRRAA